MVHDSVHIYSFLNERSADLQRVSKVLATAAANDSKRGSSGESTKGGAAGGGEGAAPATAAATELSGISNTSAPYRRTGSYQPYRTPRRVKLQRFQLKRRREEDVATAASKREELGQPCAKKRKRVAQPLSRKQKRGLMVKQGRPDWLATHVWHAKRMCMSAEFGVEMAAYHRSRGITRKLSEALATRAVVHDSSYLKPIELRGTALALAALLRRMTDAECDILVDAREEEEEEEDRSKNSSQVAGENQSMREVYVMLYRQDCFPEGCLGPCTLSLVPTAGRDVVGKSKDKGGEETCVWLWLHPSIYSLVFSELKATAAADDTSTDLANDSGSDSDSDSDSDSGRGRGGGAAPPQRARHAVGVEHVVDPPARFSVRGTNALQIVQQLLQPHIHACAETSTAEGGGSAAVCQLYSDLQGVSPRVVASLWQDGYSLAFEAQEVESNSHSKAATAPQIGPKQKKEKKKMLRWPAPAEQRNSLRWLSSASQRAQIEKYAVSLQTINSHRNALRKALFSISAHSATFMDAHTNTPPQQTGDTDVLRVPPIPVVVIKCSESCAMAKYSVPALLQRKYCMTGFDILLPQCSARRVWNAVQLQTHLNADVECAGMRSNKRLKQQAAVLAVGYREMDFLRLQAGIPSFPRDFPETTAGADYWIRQLEFRESKESHVTRRKKQSVISWKIPNWDLMRDSGDESNSTGIPEFVVARSARYADSFRRPVVRGAQVLQALPALPKMPFPTCVSVLLVPCARGVLTDGAKIMLPTAEDFELFQKHEQNKSAISNETGEANGAWHGYPSIDGVKRRVIGAITSGSSREGKGRDRGTTSPCDKRFAIGLCRVDLLHAAQSLSHQRGASREKTLVLFCNPERRAGYTGSSADGWVRPALCHISSIEF